MFDPEMEKYFKAVGMIDPDTMEPRPFQAPEPEGNIANKLDEWVRDCDPMVSRELVTRCYPNAISFLN